MLAYIFKKQRKSLYRISFDVLESSAITLYQVEIDKLM